MKVKFLVMNMHTSKEVARYDTYEEAEKLIQGLISPDLMGEASFFIRKIYTNKK